MSLNIEEIKKSVSTFITDASIDKRSYATDASIYRHIPQAIAVPNGVDQLEELLLYCHRNDISIIPRGAGTSLAGQSIGKGIIVDMSKHFNKIKDFDEQRRQINVQPGVVRDELNQYLAPFSLFFGPNTSTSNRCNIGGMLGNNSSGTTSIKYGVTRDKVISVKALLSDGSSVFFEPLSYKELLNKMQLDDLEGSIYRNMVDLLSNKQLQKAVWENFPKKDIHRRNNGYALDELLNTGYFDENSSRPFNLAPIICGSEGTLAIATQITLQLDELPPTYQAMTLAHFSSIKDCLSAVKPVMQHDLYTCEMMDKVILDCTKDQLYYQKNRSYLQGDPAALLMLECRSPSQEGLNSKIRELNASLENSTNAYAYPLLNKDEIPLIMELRKAGLGLLSLVKGDKKPVACVEDTSVAIEDLADYIEEFSATMEKYGQQAVYYAHAGAGELHIRPKINLKNEDEVKDMASLARDITILVKKYNGSISGEHGDGQLRASFLPELIGHQCYEALKQTKKIFDPKGTLNPGKIVNAPNMTEDLRYSSYDKVSLEKSILQFSPNLLAEAEQCNGSGDCRKSAAFGGVMCPSFQVTRDEKESTRARANTLREYLSDRSSVDHLSLDEVLKVFKNCVSCKACVSECPSSVDAASFKSELLYKKHKKHGFDLSGFLIAHNYNINRSLFGLRKMINISQKNKIIGGAFKKILGFHQKRELPELASQRLRSWLSQHQKNYQKHEKGVYLFVDEFTDLYGFEIGKAAVRILDKLGYNVYLADHVSSGRAEISKGYLEKARKLADHNVNLYSNLLSPDTPLIGIEPSAILSFRDDYKRLTKPEKAEQVGRNTYLFEEFIAKLIKEDKIDDQLFTRVHKKIKVHVHCHQKALSNKKATFDMLNFPMNFQPRLITSSCCGMSGSYGLETNNYEMSMKMGEVQLFPAIRKSHEDTLIAANGFSCRHQIRDGTSRLAQHPIQIFEMALR